MSLRFRIFFGCLLIFGLIAVAVMFKGYRHVENFTTLDNYEIYLRKSYAEVEHVSTDSVSALIKASIPSADLLLIDCRAPEEYQVSRIAGAINLTSSDAIEAHVKQLDPQPKTIITYCAVGERSVKINDQLLKRDIKFDLKNYTESIFSWVNQGMPIVDEKGKPTKQLHPYKGHWYKLVKQD